MLPFPCPDLSDFYGGEDLIERCGVILENDKGEKRVTGIPNRHKKTALNFQIDNNDVNKIVKRTKESVIGILHTHPKGTDPKPTSDDISNIPAGFIGIVFSQSTKTIYWYDSNGILGKETR